ncbi:hypothetical protein Tco_1262279 [Tanacetum coccineum]
MISICFYLINQKYNSFSLVTEYQISDWGLFLVYTAGSVHKGESWQRNSYHTSGKQSDLQEILHLILEAIILTKWQHKVDSSLCKLLFIARDEKWVPAKEKVKISTTNVRLETTVPQKEETFQVIINVIKNSTCYKAFTISAEVPEIFMQKFWYTIKKVSGTNSYEFLLANKKCLVDAEVFHKILDICPRVQGVDFAEVLDDETTLTFLLDLHYKGSLHKHLSMYVDHMHQPWRTMAAIINKYLSGKAASNDRLRKSRIDIL